MNIKMNRPRPPAPVPATTFLALGASLGAILTFLIVITTEVDDSSPVVYWVPTAASLEPLDRSQPPPDLDLITDLVGGRIGDRIRADVWDRMETTEAMVQSSDQSVRMVLRLAGVNPSTSLPDCLVMTPVKGDQCRLTSGVYLAMPTPTPFAPTCEEAFANPTAWARVWVRPEEDCRWSGTPILPSGTPPAGTPGVRRPAATSPTVSTSLPVGTPVART